MSVNDLIAARLQQPGEPITLEEVSLIATYELGAVIRHIFYSTRASQADIRRARLADALVELGDVITQVRLLHFLLRQDLKQRGASYTPTWEESVRDGEERMLERLEEWKTGKLG